MKPCRRYAGALALLALLALLAACGSRSSAPTVTPPTYPRPSGTLVDRSIASSLASALVPSDVPAWATPPINAAAARIALTRGTRQVVVIPYRTGPGWCLALVRDGHASFGWCTRRAGSRAMVEGGLTFFTMTSVGILARVPASVSRVVVVRADGRRVPVALRHGVALGSIGSTTRAGDRPVTVEALAPDGTMLGKRSLGWTAVAWRRANPHKPPLRPTRKQLRAMLSRPSTPCVGAPVQSGVSEIVAVSSTRPTALVADFLPAFFGDLGGKLYLTAAKPVRVTLVDGDGTRRAVPLGVANCAYVTLSSRDRRSPFRLEVRTFSGHLLERMRPNDWSGFPTDGA